MKVVVYNPLTNKAGNHLDAVIVKVVKRKELVIYRSFSTFLKRLSKPQGTIEETIVVFAARGFDDLENMLNERSRLFTARLVLILPDNDARLVKIGHELRPRFLTFIDNGIDQFGLVLENMVRIARLNEEISEARQNIVAQ